MGGKGGGGEPMASGGGDTSPNVARMQTAVQNYANGMAQAKGPDDFSRVYKTYVNDVQSIFGGGVDTSATGAPPETVMPTMGDDAKTPTDAGSGVTTTEAPTTGDVAAQSVGGFGPAATQRKAKSMMTTSGSV